MEILSPEKTGKQIGHCPVVQDLNAKVLVPGSKSLTQRAMVAAALCDGKSRIKGPLISEDTTLLKQALEKLGAGFEKDGRDYVVRGTGGKINPGPIELYMGNNGTGIRFLTSVVALGHGTYKLSGTRRMGERPIQPLLDALSMWGARAISELGTGCPPVEVVASGLSGGKTLISAKKSSQFLSSLLLVAPYTREPANITLDGPLVSRPYVDLTLSVMEQFGVTVEEKDLCFLVPQNGYRPCSYEVEGDASSASYFFAAAAVTGGKVTVQNIPSKPLQGDAAFVDILQSMGCEVTRDEQGTTVTGPKDGGLRGIEINMSRWPDVVPTLAVVAAFATGQTIITHVEHLRIKETDRIKAVATELSKMGADVEELEDGLVINGGRLLHGARIHTYDDHRIAMSFAVAGLRVPGVKIENPECVQKSFPEFWSVWDNMTKNT